MWPFLFKLGVVSAAIGIGLGVILLLQQDAFHYQQNRRQNDNRFVPDLQPRRRKSNKCRQKGEKNLKELLEEQLNSGTAECIICKEFMTYKEEVWPCPFCRNLFHLKCITHWARINSEAFYWKCPFCRKEINERIYPLIYKCMCGSVKSPKELPGVTPHCCGQKCQDCESKCHPGPCERGWAY